MLAIALLASACLERKPEGLRVQPSPAKQAEWQALQFTGYATVRGKVIYDGKPPKGKNVMARVLQSTDSCPITHSVNYWSNKDEKIRGNLNLVAQKDACVKIPPDYEEAVNLSNDRLDWMKGYI